MRNGPGLIWTAMTFATLVIAPSAAVAAELGRGRGPAAPSAAAIHGSAEARALPTRAGQARLRDMLTALESRTTLRFRLANPDLGDRVVSDDVSDQSTEEILRRLLRGFSYVIHEDGHHHVVTIVAGPAPALAAPGRTRQPTAAGPDVPEMGRSVQTVLVRRFQEAQLRRSLMALDVGPAADRSEHLEALVGLNDGRATEALVRDARLGTPPLPEVRRVAVQRLWRHAAALGFADAASVGALRQLATDGDETVAEVAVRALQDLRGFRGHPTEQQAP